MVRYILAGTLLISLDIFFFFFKASESPDDHCLQTSKIKAQDSKRVKSSMNIDRETQMEQNSARQRTTKKKAQQRVKCCSSKR